METESFFEQPYSNRQLIVFIDDAAIIAAENASQALPKKSDSEPHSHSKEADKTGTTGANGRSNTLKENKSLVSTWASAGRTIGGILALEGLRMAVGAVSGLAIWPFRADIETIKSSNQAKEEGVENLILVGKSKIAYFKLPPGHPRNRIVYAGHPALPEVYVPLADFHRLTFEHKFSEVISLLMHLGAKTIKVEHVTGWGTEFSSRLSAGLPSAGLLITDIGAEANAIKESQQTLLFDAELENSHPSSLPDNLVWYPYESTWQQVAKGRLEFGLKNFNLTLNYNDDYGINAGIKFKIDRAGLDAGGSFEKYTATTWRIYGNF